MPGLPAEVTSPPLTRRFGLLQATALNMINMIGIGPFITIPLLMTALGGPQAMLGWIVALVIVVVRRHGVERAGRGDAGVPADRSATCARRFGRETFGRLMAFLFVWQFILSGPLEIASGYIGFANYARLPVDRPDAGAACSLVSAAVGVVNIALLYRRITSIATITVSLVGGHDDRGRRRHRDRRACISIRTWRSTFRPTRSTSRSASCSASARHRGLRSTTTLATTTSATSATR